MTKYQIVDYLMDEFNTQNDQFASLVQHCLDARISAEKAREAQLLAENKILKLQTVKELLKDSGSTTFLGGLLKIVTKLNSKWNQKLLHNIIKNNEWSIMPFEIEYKPVASHLQILKEQFPEQYKKLLPALEVTPAKPYFQFSKE